MSFFTDASFVMDPNVYGVGKLYVPKPTDGTGDLTFTRASTGTRVNQDGLIEKVRTNLILQSQTFDNAVYDAKVNITVSANTSETLDPSGNSNADKITSNSTVGNHFIRQPLTVTPSTTYTSSVYIKAGNTSVFTIGDGYNINVLATFDLAAVTATNVTGFNANIQSVGNGWYRCSASMIPSGTTMGLMVYSGTTYAGAETDKYYYLFGAQVEVSDFGATDYIPTTTSAVSVGPLANIPRLNYGSDGCPSLLLEPQRTNLATYSEQIDSWGKVAVTVTSNDGTSPTGYNDAESIIPNTSNNSHIVYKDIVITSGNSYTASFFVKSAGYTSCAIRLGVGSLWAGGQGPTVLFDLDALTGSVIDGSGVTYKIEDYGNGWRRCSVTGSCVSSGTTSFLLYVKEYGPFIGDGTSGLLAFGGSLEAGSYATSYIPTLSTSVTRLADACSKTGISSLIGQTEGTLFVEANFTSGYDTNNLLMTLSDGLGGSNLIYINRSAGKFEIFVQSALVSQMLYLSPTVLSAGTHKVALGYKANDFVIYIDGVLVHTDTSGSVPACSKLNVGSYWNNAFTYNSGINQALLFKTRLTNADLARLTSL
jgi:hypothetical protein